MGGPQRHGRRDAVGELNEAAARLKHIEGLFEQNEALAFRAGPQRQARHDRRGGRIEGAPQRVGQGIGIALNDGRPRIAAGQELAELRVELHQHEALGRHAARDQRFGDGPGAGSEFDDRAGAVGIDIARHGAGQETAGRRDRTGPERVLEPGLDETRLVGQTLVERLLRVSRSARFGVQRAISPSDMIPPRLRNTPSPGMVRASATAALSVIQPS